MDTSKKLREQINNFFPSYYTTLISIIQATSFGYLLVGFSKYVESSNDPFSYHLVLYLVNLFVSDILVPSDAHESGSTLDPTENLVFLVDLVLNSDSGSSLIISLNPMSAFSCRR